VVPGQVVGGRTASRVGLGKRIVQAGSVQEVFVEYSCVRLVLAGGWVFRLCGVGGAGCVGCRVGGVGVWRASLVLRGVLRD